MVPEQGARLGTIPGGCAVHGGTTGQEVAPSAIAVWLPSGSALQPVLWKGEQCLRGHSLFSSAPERGRPPLPEGARSYF